MARSSYIYIVEYYSKNYEINTLGAFTVKHEAIEAIKNHADPTNLAVTRYKDGQFSEGYIYSIEEFVK